MEKEASIVIVSRNRKEDLDRTLEILLQLVDSSVHEILVFLDGCNDGSEALISKFPSILWSSSEHELGASAARSILYPTAKGRILFGFDDDAHPVTPNFIQVANNLFENPKVGVLAFREIRGIFPSEADVLANVDLLRSDYLCSEFIGCGFAIKKEVYNSTNGFPKWIDIYGEESCVSIEVLDKGFDILYTNKIVVNHRVDLNARRKNEHQYFRFKKQLKNVTFYYLVYYRFPFYRIASLFAHNFRKYALSDFKYFAAFMGVWLKILVSLPKVLRHRAPVSSSTINKIKLLRSPDF